MSIALLTSKPQKARNMNIKPGRPPFLNIFLVQTKTSDTVKTFIQGRFKLCQNTKIQCTNHMSMSFANNCTPFQFLKKGLDLSLINVKPTEIYSVVSSVYLHFPSLPVVHVYY